MRTRAKLAEAFTTLARSNASSLSVSAIVGVAGLNRSSFYAHFATTSELALYVLDQALVAIAVDDIRTRRAGLAHGADASVIVLSRIVDQVESQKDELLAIFDSDAGGDGRQRFGERVRSNVADYLDLLELTPDKTRAEREAAAVFVGQGLAASIVAWLTGELRCSRHELVTYVTALVPDWIKGSPLRSSTPAPDRA